MSHGDIIAITIIVQATTIAIIGGGLLAEMPSKICACAKQLGVMLLLISLQRFNGIRVAGLERDETWSVTILRIITITVAVLVVATFLREKRSSP